MKRILLIGNGFDLAHKLPTRYGDFLYVCMKYIGKEFDYDSPNLNDLSNILSLFIKKYGNSYKKLIGDNIWIEYFVKKFNKIGNNWIDFEKEIRNVCEKRIESISNKGPDFTSIIEYSMFLDNNSFDFLKMKKHHIELIKILDSYLNIINDLKTDVYSEDILRFAPTDVISFNYTNTYDKIYNIRNNIDYIHGMTSSKKNNDSIDSFGDNKIDSEYAEFLKYFQMVNNDIKLNILDANNKDVYSMIFGHSLDVNDFDVISDVINKSKKIFILYYTNAHKCSMIKNLITVYGEKEFRELCLSENKRIFFIKQMDMCNVFGIFTSDCISSYKRLLLNDITHDEFIRFILNYLDSINFGIIGTSEIFINGLKLFQLGIINEDELNDLTKRIYTLIDNYYKNDTFYICDKKTLFDKLNSKYNFVIKYPRKVINN